MNVKGTAIRSITEYLHNHYPRRYQEFLNALPPQSKIIFSDTIYTSKWYPLTGTLTIPLRVIANVYFNGDQKLTARTMGRYSAETALTGIYKIYVQIGSVRHIVERASRVMSAYFEPSQLKVVHHQKNNLVIHITEFPESDIIVEENIAGWMERAIEISGGKHVEVIITKSLTKNDPYTELTISWQ